jgi:hypothetical protein
MWTIKTGEALAFSVYQGLEELGFYPCRINEFPFVVIYDNTAIIIDGDEDKYPVNASILMVL